MICPLRSDEQYELRGLHDMHECHYMQIEASVRHEDVYLSLRKYHVNMPLELEVWENLDEDFRDIFCIINPTMVYPCLFQLKHIHSGRHSTGLYFEVLCELVFNADMIP